jgi:hypothetical protein
MDAFCRGGQDRDDVDEMAMKRCFEYSKGLTA